MKKMPIKNIVNFHKELKDLDQNAIIERKNVFVELIEEKALDNSSDEIFTGIISKPTIDTDCDIIVSEGVDASIYNGALQFNHDLNNLPIGEVFDYNISKEGVIGKFRFSNTYSFAVDIKNLVKEKILKGISIGFIPQEVLLAGTAAFKKFANERGLNIEGCKRIITKALWIETSIVPVGSHPDALMLYSKSFTSDLTCKALKLEVPLEKIEHNPSQEIIDMVKPESCDEEVDKKEIFEDELLPVIEESVNEDIIKPEDKISADELSGVNPEQVNEEVQETISEETEEKEDKPEVEIELEVKPVKEDNLFKWGNLTNSDKDKLREQVYGIWEGMGSPGDFNTFWETGKISEEKHIKFSIKRIGSLKASAEIIKKSINLNKGKV